jgi:putative phosphoesterase
MRLALISDTHVGDRSVDLAHPEMWQAIEEADITIHAGDWTSLEFFEEVVARSQYLVGVKGNNDQALGTLLPEIEVVMLEGLFFTVVHIATIGEMDDRFPLADVVVFGHSHRIHDSVSPDGKRLLNPGSTMNYERWSGGSNLMTAELVDGELTVWTHRLRNADRPITLWPRSS